MAKAINRSGVGVLRCQYSRRGLAPEHPPATSIGVIVSTIRWDEDGDTPRVDMRNA